VETIATFPTDAAQTTLVMTAAEFPDRGESGLVERAVAGDVEAFEELYRVNVGRVYALCLRMAGDPTLAEELAQEAFVRAWQKLGSFRGASAFSRVRAVGDDLPHDVAGPEAGTAESIDLERAISSLPDGARTVFVLHDVEGFRHQDVSRLMGIAAPNSSIVSMGIWMVASALMMRRPSAIISPGVPSVPKRWRWHRTFVSAPPGCRDLSNRHGIYGLRSRSPSRPKGWCGDGSSGGP